MNRAGVRASLLYLLFFFSGAAGLGYQMGWLRMFASGLGHEMPAALAVVCAFMGGMGLGAWALDRAISRSQWPGYWYAALEIVIGLWAFLSTALIPLINEWALQATGLEPTPLRQWSIAFLLPFMTILPATAAMGATFPAMERFVFPLIPDGRCIGAIYAANTLGAVAGTLCSAFLIVPSLGLRESIWCFGGINLACGIVAFLMVRRTVEPVPDTFSAAFGSPKQGVDQKRQAADKPNAPALSNRRLRLTLFCAGLLGIGYETAGLRVLSQVLENTAYTFAAVLSVFLLGTSAGAAFYQRFGGRLFSGTRHALHNNATAPLPVPLPSEGRGNPLGRLVALADLLCALSLAGLLGVLALAKAQSLYDSCRNALSDNAGGVLVAEVAVAAAVFGLPTFLMGVLFSHLVQEAKRPEGGVGRAAALNTFGGALAPALVGVLLLAATGSKWTLVLVSLGYLALQPKVTGWRWALLAAPLVLILMLPANLQLVQLGTGGKLADFREGTMASVAVIEDASGNKTLRVNNRFQMGGTGAADAEYRHAHIPLLLHPAPKRALFLGLGTGITFGAASLHPDLKSDGVELVPEVVAVMPQFAPFNFEPERQPALKLHVADARRFIRVTEERYDVIVADLFHPARDGAGSLYTVEHFQAARRCLAPGGIFCQWLPLHQLDDQMLRIIARTFLEVFPDAQAYLLRFNVDAPVVGLMGCLDWPRYSPQWIEKRLADPNIEQHLKKLSLADSIRFFGTLIAGPGELREFAGDAPLNTDDQPRITFGAPRFTYQKNANSYGRLMALLNHRIVNPGAVLKLGPDIASNQFAKRLLNYMSARDVYLAGLVEETEGRSAQALDAYVESARLSDDFTPGYAQCLTIVSLEAKSKPAKARALLQRLVEAQPSRPVAREMLKRMSGE